MSGVEGLLGLGGDIRHAIDYGTLWATAHAMEEAGQLPKGQTADHFIRRNRGSYMRAFLNKLGVSNASIDAASQAVAPTTEDVHGAVKSLGVPDYTPQTTTGKYANTVASFLPGVLGTPASGPLELAANAARYAVVPGIASEAAGQATEGTQLEPWARLAGGMGAGSASATGESAIRNAVRLAKNFVEPMSGAGQRAIAARTLQSQFTNPQQASKELAAASALQVPGSALGETVPGSKPTTGQLTGDLGALSLEREFATRQPDLYKANEFGTGAEQQNAARTAALNGISGQRRSCRRRTVRSGAASQH